MRLIAGRVLATNGRVDKLPARAQRTNGELINFKVEVKNGRTLATSASRASRYESVGLVRDRLM